MKFSTALSELEMPVTSMKSDESLVCTDFAKLPRFSRFRVLLLPLNLLHNTVIA